MKDFNMRSYIDIVNEGNERVDEILSLGAALLKQADLLKKGTNAAKGSSMKRKTVADDTLARKERQKDVDLTALGKARQARLRELARDSKRVE
jgi:hypothetical protein